MKPGHHIRHPIGGHDARHGPEHQVIHDKVLRREQPHHNRPLSFHHDGDHASCLLPDAGSHTQGQEHHHDGYLHRRGLSKRGETARNAPMDRKPPGKGY
jgi:hypothetical protein